MTDNNRRIPEQHDKVLCAVRKLTLRHWISANVEHHNSR
jgi:hypothetical protein